MILLAGLTAVVLLTARPMALSGAVSAEVGPEYDSNANRADQGRADADPVQGSFLLRAQASGQLQYQRGRHGLRVQLSLGGKQFFASSPAVQDQNVGVIQLGYEEAVQLGRLRLGGVLDYYDAYQQAAASSGRARDVRTGGTGLRLSGAAVLARLHQLDGDVDLTGQYFQYKPDAAYSFVAPSLAARLRLRLHAGDPELGHDFELSLRGRVDGRSYFLGDGRLDAYGELGVGLSWIGPVLLQAGYALQVNPTGQLGPDGYQRHAVSAKVAARLPGEVYLTVKGQITTAGVVPTATIDEDRSLAMVDLQRALPRGFTLSCRYTGFFNVGWFGPPATDYQRHTVYLGVGYRFRGQRR